VRLRRKDNIRNMSVIAHVDHGTCNRPPACSLTFHPQIALSARAGASSWGRVPSIVTPPSASAYPSSSIETRPSRSSRTCSRIPMRRSASSTGVRSST
jgi:hypothetical protein